MYDNYDDFPCHGEVKNPPTPKAKYNRSIHYIYSRIRYQYIHLVATNIKGTIESQLLPTITSNASEDDVKVRT